MAETVSQTLNAPNGLKPQTVSFPSGEGYIVAHLYLPENYDASKRYPAVAVGGSFNSIKEQQSGIYASEMARRGIMAMAIDYRNYGESSGAIRQLEDPDGKAVDLSAALQFLRNRSDVSGTGLLGVCTSGGTVLYAAAKDKSVGAVATVAGFFSEPALSPLLMGGEEGVSQRRAKAREAQKLYDETGVIEYVRAYHDTDTTAANVGQMDYYLDETRGAVPVWRNATPVLGFNAMIDFDPVSKASQVTAPTLVVHSDGSAFPDLARKVYSLLAGPKDLYWGEGAHFEFYDQAPQVNNAADHVAEHFRANLS